MNIFQIPRLLTQLLAKVDKLMTDISGLQTDVTALRTSVDKAKTALDDLAAKVAALSAGTVTQQQIDDLDASVQAARSELDTAVATDDPTS